MKEQMYYAYCLFRDSVPFYIGKGNGRRIEGHESCARNKENCRHLPCRVIRKAWREGQIITKVKLFDHLTEPEAHQHEMEMIAFGRSEGWPLVNLTDGGEGVSGYRWTPEQREMRRQIVLQEMQEQKERYDRFKYANVGRVMSQEEREKRSSCVSAAWSDESLRETQRQRQLNRWANPEERAKQKERMNNPAIVANNSAKNKGHTRKAQTYPGFISPDGTVYENVHNLALFCEQHTLQKSNMCLVNAGKQHDHKGWTRYPPIEQQPKKIRQPVNPYTGFISPDGQVHTPTNLRAFCIEHGLQPSAMSMLNAEQIQQYRGWTKVKP